FVLQRCLDAGAPGGRVEHALPVLLLHRVDRLARILPHLPAGGKGAHRILREVGERHAIFCMGAWHCAGHHRREHQSCCRRETHRSLLPRPGGSRQPHRTTPAGSPWCRRRRAIVHGQMPLRTGRAVVQTAPRTLELRELPLPELTDDTRLLRIGAWGICASDPDQYPGVLPVRFPLVPGHEPLGIIEAIGDRAAKRWGVEVGDRVAVEALIPCGHCAACRGGRYSVCRGRGAMFGHGYVSLDRPPGLWGAYADYMHLDAFSIVHRVRADLPPSIAVLFNPLGAGFRSAVELPRTAPGD